MPNQPKTPQRSVRIADDLWRSVQTQAQQDGVSVSDVIRSILEAYAHGLDRGTRGA